MSSKKPYISLWRVRNIVFLNKHEERELLRHEKLLLC